MTPATTSCGRGAFKGPRGQRPGPGGRHLEKVADLHQAARGEAQAGDWLRELERPYGALFGPIGVLFRRKKKKKKRWAWLIEALHGSTKSTKKVEKWRASVNQGHRCFPKRTPMGGNRKGMKPKKGSHFWGCCSLLNHPTCGFPFVFGSPFETVHSQFHRKLPTSDTNK